MLLIQISIIFITTLLIVNILLTLKACKKEVNNVLTEINNSLALLPSFLKEIEKYLKDEFVSNRFEYAETAPGIRTEIGNQLHKFNLILNSADDENYDDVNSINHKK